MKKLNNVPVDEDTKVVFQQEAKLGDYDVLYQKWHWDGIIAESIIFSNEDIMGLEEEEIIRIVQAFPSLKKASEITFTQTDSGFTFVNFNFESA